jgi:predicted nucleic acid-binding protein
VKSARPVDLVVDASVIAKFYFFENGSEQARAILTSGIVVAAPGLLFIEIASVAATKVRRGLSTREQAREAVVSLGDLVDEFVALGGLASRAFSIASDSGCSAYDATYLALAQERSVRVLTADTRLVDRARAAGMEGLVRSL